MKITKILKAFFFHKEDPIELDLSAAEIMEGKAYLHPKTEKGVTYLVRSDNIEISLSKGLSLTSKDVIRIEDKPANSVSASKQTSIAGADNTPLPKTQRSTKTSNAIDSQEDIFEKYRKRKFVVSLYPDEYDSLISSMKEYGYKRADFVLACVNSASRGTMERAHKKIVQSHNTIKKERQTLMTQHTNND